MDHGRHVIGPLACRNRAKSAWVTKSFQISRGFDAAIHPTLKLFGADPRALPRQRIFKAGTIEFDGAGIDCIVRNLSAVGAGLEVASPAGIPHEITLNIRSCEMRRHAYIVWRKEKRLGVAFG
jgi:hypothetical protein